jgi:hypothetical protein
MTHRSFAVALCALAGCSSFFENKAAESTFRILDKSQVAARRLADVELARDAMPGGLVQLEAFALAYPNHRGFRLLHAEALCQFGIAFVFDDWEDAELRGREADAAKLKARVTTLAGACVEAQLALLPRAWRDARTAGADAWDARVAAAIRADVPHLLWITTADAVALALDPLQHLENLPVIVRGLERSIELHPGAHDSDAELLLGTLEANRSRFVGGSDGSARFGAARSQLGDGALLVDVMFARGTLVAKQDRAAFEATLRKVLAADPARWPERRLANALARRKAERYLAAIDRLIPKADKPTE